MKILTMDIETSPALGNVWGLWNQNVGLNQLREVSEVISFAAKWYGDPQVQFYSTFHSGRQNMLAAAHKLMSETDVLVTYNGDKFDNKHMNREFEVNAKPPLGRPAPYVSVDLLKVVKGNFRFMSNKLDHVVQQLELGGKVSTGGFELWLGCMNNDPDAWSKMREYNMHDVEITEQLFTRLRPWITNLPHAALFGDGVDAQFDSCPACDSVNLNRQGFRYTAQGKYQRYRCAECGTWSQSGRATVRFNTRRFK